MIKLVEHWASAAPRQVPASTPVAACSVKLRLAVLLGNGTGRVPLSRTGFADELSASTRPDSILRWLTRPHAAVALNELGRLLELASA